MKRILITGCRGGIGLASAKRFLDAGHFVYVTTHKKNSVFALKKELKKYGERVVVEKLDLLDERDYFKVDSWEVDVLINNAAIGDSGPLSEIPIERVREVFETNVFAALKFTQRILKKMILRRSGRVIFIGSIAGLIPTPYYSPYAMTKFALENIVFSLRSELKPFDIDVIMINPGTYHTGFNEKFILKKYMWMKKNSVYMDFIDRIKKSEKDILDREIFNLNSISKRIFCAALTRHPKRRYCAPFWQYWAVPFLRRFW